MRKYILALSIIFAFGIFQSIAQTPCSPATAQVDLDINNVRARLLNGGDLWWDPVAQVAGYEIPKGSGLHSIFAGAFWIGGIDASGQLHLAGQTYRQTGDDFWPGPLNTTNASVDSTVCKQYDKIWKLNRQDAINVLSGTGIPTVDMITYPGNGNVNLGQAPFLAPFYDFNANGIYEPLAGEVPKFQIPGSTNINCSNKLLGDQALWWIFNDVGNSHTQTNGLPLGLEIHAMAYAYSGNDSILNNTTLYQYKIINRSNQNYSDTYIGLWRNSSIGNASDEFAGCHVTKGLGYSYNGDSFDQGIEGYGYNPPAVATDFLRGPVADINDGIDNDFDGIIDEPKERINFSNFLVYNSVSQFFGEPHGTDNYYRYLKSIWGAGQPMTFGGDGKNSQNPVTHFMYPGDSDPAFPGQTWSETNYPNSPGWRSMISSCGPFTMNAGEVNTLDFALIWARENDSDTLNWPTSLNELFAASDHVQAFFDALCDSTIFSGVANNELDFGIHTFPVPANDFVTIEFTNNKADDFMLELFSLSGEKIYSNSNIKESKLKIITSELGKGVYLYKLTKQLTGKFNSGKLIIN